ncbi:MAG: PAS domain-containing protein [Rhizobiales bacterium]|nr:PAS domain-containing protein [Hyphomicrobiales bacterium]
MLKGARIALTAQDADLRYTGALNGSFLFDGKDYLGASDPSFFSADAGRQLLASKQRVAATGKGESVDVSMVLGEETQWHRLWIEPLPLDDAGTGIIAAAVDVTGQKVAEEHLRLALLELAHRSKNLLAVVLSIARQSADDSQSLAQFSTRFVGRIRALALAHDVLTDESWRGATVFSLVRSQLSAFSENASAQSEITGHNAYLKPNAVQYVGLALHELIAQSVVSGALSAPDGTIRVESALAAEESSATPVLRLRWVESGPHSGAQDQSEFGHALLERIIPAALGGTATLTAEPDLLTYELTIPSAQFF